MLPPLVMAPLCAVFLSLLAGFFELRMAALGAPFEELEPPALEQPLPPDTQATAWSLSVFSGVYDDSRFVEILRGHGGDYRSSYIAGLALARPVSDLERRLVWELEGSAYRHFGMQDVHELNAAVVARWTELPWDRHLDTSIAFGQGISWASERPAIEDETRQLLHHLSAELEVSPRRAAPLSLVLRVHHRSGVFGLYGVSGGSNFVTLGLRYRL